MNRPGPSLRGPLASVSALVVVGLLLGSSLRALEPAVRDIQRDTGTDRIAVRQISATLAKAVRELVGSDTHKPCVLNSSRLNLAAGADHPVWHATAAADVPQERLLRTELLDLPPPALLV